MYRQSYIFIKQEGVPPPLEEALAIVDENYEQARAFDLDDVKKLGFGSVESFRKEQGVNDETVETVKGKINLLYSLGLPSDVVAKTLEDVFGKWIELYDFKMASLVGLPSVPKTISVPEITELTPVTTSAALEYEQPVPEVVYTDILKKVYDKYASPYWTLDPTVLRYPKAFEAAKSMLLHTINSLNFKYMQEATMSISDPEKREAYLNTKLIKTPDDQTILEGLERALERAYERESGRLPEDVVFKEDIPLPPETVPGVKRILEQVPGLQEFFVETPKIISDWEQFIAPDTYIFDFAEFAKFYGISELKKEFYKKHLEKSGFSPFDEDRYRIKGTDEYRRFKDLITQLIKEYQPSQSVTSRLKQAYFNLFKEYDVGGPSWYLDKESKKIVKIKKPVNVEKAVREGGVWEYKEGDTVLFSGDDDDDSVCPVTIVSRLPFQTYIVKNSLGEQFETTESKLFTLEKLI